MSHRPASVHASSHSNFSSTTNAASSNGGGGGGSGSSSNSAMAATTTTTTNNHRARQYTHLHAQLAQLNARLADTENLLRMTAVQAEYVRGLGGWCGGLFMASAKVLGEETVAGSMGGGSGGGGTEGEKGKSSSEVFGASAVELAGDEEDDEV